MIYLGTLIYIDTIKEIINKNPSLIYLICYIGNSGRIKLDSRIIFNLEEECEKLSKFSVINYKSSSKRPTHEVSNINFTRFGRSIYDELQKHKICKEISKILDFNSQECFSKSFYQNFSFEVNPSDEIKKQVSEVRKLIPIPENYYRYSKSGNHLIVEYKKVSNRIIVEIKIQCRCTNLLIEQVDLKLFKHNLETCFRDYILKCNSCQREFYISPNLFNFKYI